MIPRTSSPTVTTSSQIYGFAYQALQRRMKMIGVEIPGPEVLMPGPVEFTGLDERRVLAGVGYGP